MINFLSALVKAQSFELKTKIEAYHGLIHRYRDYLPAKEKSIVTLLEGNTPLMKVNRLREKIGLPCDLYLKFEGLNPTCSFKDRGMTYAVTKAVEEGAKAIICASTGNTSASAAAYAARAKLKAYVLIPKGNIAYGKLSQAMMYGATVIQIKGNFDEALQRVRELGANYPVHVVNSVNLHRLQGQKTASFEICDSLGRAPTHHILPVGNAGNISAYWMGYEEYFKEKKIKRKPKMMGFQASRASPIVRGKPVKDPQTIASAIKIGNPASWQKAILARDASGGMIDKVTDAEILKAYKYVAQYEGYFCEPASAVSIAGVIKKNKEGYFKKSDLLVCTLTGHGLKDPDIAIDNSKKAISCGSDLKSILKVMKL